MTPTLGPIRRTYLRDYHGVGPSRDMPNLVRDVLTTAVCTYCNQPRFDRRFGESRRLLLFGWHVRSDLVAWDTRFFCSLSCRFMWRPGGF